MKRADIKTGQVYGHNEGRERIYRYQPVVVLSLDSYRLDRYTRLLAKSDSPREGLTTGRSTYSSAVGLLAVMLNTECTSPQDVAKLLRVATPEAAVAGINGAGRQVFDPDVLDRVLGRYMLLTRAQYLHGDYHELTDALTAREQRNRTIAQQNECERIDRLNRYRALNDRLEALGVKDGQHVSQHAEVYSFKLYFDGMEKLIELAELAGRYNDYGQREFGDAWWPGRDGMIE